MLRLYHTQNKRPPPTNRERPKEQRPPRADFHRHGKGRERKAQSKRNKEHPRPRAVLLSCLPFRAAETKARKPQHSTPRGCSVQTPPDMAAPRIEAIRYENNRPRPTNRERPKRRRERRGCSVQTPPEYRQRGQPPRRVEKKSTPPRCSFAACAAFALSFDVSQARPLFVQQKTKARKPPPAPPRGAASKQPARI